MGQICLEFWFWNFELRPHKFKILAFLLGRWRSMGFTPVTLRLRGISTKAARRLSTSGASAAAATAGGWWAAACSWASRSVTSNRREQIPLSFDRCYGSSCYGTATVRAGLARHHDGHDHGDRSSPSYNCWRRESAAGYHVNPSSSMRGVVFWEPNRPMSLEYLQIPRPKSGELLIKTKGNVYRLSPPPPVPLFEFLSFSINTRSSNWEVPQAWR